MKMQNDGRSFWAWGVLAMGVRFTSAGLVRVPFRFHMPDSAAAQLAVLQQFATLAGFRVGYNRPTSNVERFQVLKLFAASFAKIAQRIYRAVVHHVTRPVVCQSLNSCVMISLVR